MKDEVLVSVITPMYNAKEFIAETIQSVLEQTYQNWEMIIVDNCSTDNCKEIVTGFIKKDNRIRLIELEYNSGGPARPRNIGLDNAKGEYVAFLDADDTFIIEKLSLQIDYMKKNNLNFCSTDHNFICDNSRLKHTNIITELYKKRNYQKETTIQGLVFFNKIYTSTVMIKKNVMQKFDEDPLLIAKEDVFLWLNLLLNNNIKYNFFNKKMTNYRILSNSLSRDQISKDRIKQIYAITKFILQSNRLELWKSLKKLILLRLFKK